MNKRLISLVFFFSAGIVFALKAQPEQGQYVPDYDTSYIRDFRHRFNFSIVAEGKQNTINALSSSNKIINYQTNLALPNYGFMFSYRWLNAQLTLPMPGISYTRPDRGETRSYAVGLGFTSRKWYFRNFLEYFKGYYMSNPWIVYPDFIQGVDKLPVYPNMESITYYLTGYYGLNGKKYSHRALLWQSEMQKKSAGSFLLGFTGAYKNIKSPQAMFISEELQAGVNEVEYYVAGFNMGYTYTFAIAGHFNASAMLVPGMTYIFGAYQSDQSIISISENSFGLSGEGRVQVFYEKNNFFTGLSYTGYVFTNLITDETKVGSTHNYLRLNVGYRFKLRPIKFLKPLGLSN
jgi:hypothetical protein